MSEEAPEEVPPAEEAAAPEGGEAPAAAEGEGEAAATAAEGGEAPAAAEGEAPAAAEGEAPAAAEGEAPAAAEGESADAPAPEEAPAEEEAELEPEASEEVELDEDGNPIVKEEAKPVVKEDKDMIPFMCNVYLPARKMTFSVTVFNKCEIEDIQRQIAAKLTKCDETEYLLQQVKLTYRDVWDADAGEPKEVPLEDKKTVKDYYITPESMPRATIVAAE